MTYYTQKSEKTNDQRKLKGQATRERLIIEAINLFGQKGYNSTNTRSLAEAAACNLGLITFHFGGKKGLYDAAITRVKNRLNELICPTIEILESHTNDNKISNKELFDISIQCIEKLSLNLIGIEQLAGHGLLLLRDSHNKIEDSNITYKTVFFPLVNAFEKALDKATSYKNPLYARMSAFMIINASLEFLRNYSIFYPKKDTENTFAPTMPYVVNLLISRLLGDYEDV